MGERFQVMALSRGLDEAFCEGLDGFSLADLRYRLLLHWDSSVS